jgi:regulator of RNase E activity RraA
MVKRLGGVGLVTDGGVRDLETVHSMGFQMFAVGAVPAHGNHVIEETQVPVEVGGVLVNPGDVVHADVNGVVVFPLELTDHVITESARVTERESAIHKWILSDEFSLKGLENRK